jgi:hypothetical protein
MSMTSVEQSDDGVDLNPSRDPRRPHQAPIDHAVRLIYQVCCLAGCFDFIDDIRSDLRTRGIARAIQNHDTPTLFDWLVEAFSYHGISNYVAEQYIDNHGQVTWHSLEETFSKTSACPKLESYWHFHQCRYHKASRTCGEPDHIAHCRLPTYDLRNGRLNQTAYSFYLFIRDIADRDLVGWIDAALATAAVLPGPTRLARMRKALIEPLRHVYGVSDKVLLMALSSMMLGAPAHRRLWLELGASMIVIDTLVHNFLHRTGILRRFGADHAYGSACYDRGNCVDVIEAVAGQIDARAFNSAFPPRFPRFIQHAVWHYCADQGFDVCNGNRIDDRKSCTNNYCRLYSICDRIRLNT